MLDLDRGGPKRQPRRDAGEMLDLYASTPMIEARDVLSPCVLHRRCEVDLPLPERDHFLLQRSRG